MSYSKVKHTTQQVQQHMITLVNISVHYITLHHLFITFHPDLTCYLNDALLHSFDLRLVRSQQVNVELLLALLCRSQTREPQGTVAHIEWCAEDVTVDPPQ